MVVLALISGALLTLDPKPAHAATFTVNSTDDGGDKDFTNGICDTGLLIFPTLEAQCTLRAAIQQANATSGADTIDVSVGSVTLSVVGISEELAAMGDLDIRQDVIIEGNGVTVTAGESFNDRIFHVVSPAKATIKGVSIERGEGIDGGGVYVASGAKLDLIGSTVKGNLAIDPDPGGEIMGGGIYNGGNLTVARSTISGNTSEASGGRESYGAGLFNNGPATITDSTLSGNQAVSTNATMAASHGGGIFNESDLKLTNVTVSGNGAFGATSIGGGIYNANRLTLTNATASGNSASFGANLYNLTHFPLSAPLDAKNTIVANPQGGGANCYGVAYSSSGPNLEYPGTSCRFNATGDIQNQDPLLGPLADNGGPTRTHALLSGSPAIDAGTNTGCPGADQRGVIRPQDGNDDGSAVCDIGAFEADIKAPDTTIVSGPSGTVNTTSATFGFTSSEPGSTFRCSLDAGVFDPCSSPKSYSNLKDGYHVLRVRAIDAAGNDDPTPAVRSWTVDTVRPSITPLRPVPGSTIRDRTPLIAATVADDRTDLTGRDMALYVDGERKRGFPYDPPTDMLTYKSGRLSFGRHVVKITADDVAGNGSARVWAFKVVR